MHNYTLQQADNSSGSDESAKQEKQQKRKNQKKDDKEDSEECTFVRICTHLKGIASAYICMHLYASICIWMHWIILGFISPLYWEHCESLFSLASVVAVHHGLPTERQDSLYTSPVAATTLVETLCVCRAMGKKN